MSSIKAALCGALALVGTLGGIAAAAGGVNGPGITMITGTFYTRLAQVGSTLYAHSQNAVVMRSDDQGRSWQRVSSGPLTEEGACCADLYAIPRAIGTGNNLLPTGTLLAAYSVNLPPVANAGFSRNNIKLLYSTDGGVTWQTRSVLPFVFAATVDRFAPRAGGPANVFPGVWEPELIVKPNGDLVMYYSDETQATFSQVLRQVVSTDGGLSWSAPTTIVSIPSSANRIRPGMPRVEQINESSYLMVYEMINDNAPGAANGQLYYRTSTDGINWGDITNKGTLIQTPSGVRLVGTPAIEAMSNGQLVVAGAGGVGTPQKTLSAPISGAGIIGAWQEYQTPFRPGGDFGGYSADLLDLGSGELLYFAGNNINGSIDARYAIGTNYSAGLDAGVAQETSGAIDYSGSWQSFGFPGYAGGLARFTQTSGSSLQFTFFGSRARLFGESGPGAGTASIFVAGQLVQSINLGQGPFNPNALMFDTGDLPRGAYQVRLQSTSNGWVGLDQIDVTDGLTTGTYDNDEPRLELTPTTTYSEPTAFGGTIASTNIVGPALTIRFTGTGVRVFGPRDLTFGKLRIYKDFEQTFSSVDLYSSTFLPDTQIAAVTGLPYGRHVVYLEVDPDKNPAAFDRYFEFDRIVVE